MTRLITHLIAPLLPAIIPLILLAACATTPARDAAQACEAARSGDIVSAIDAADRAYNKIDKLTTRDLCQLASSYAIIAIVSGDLGAADRFEDVYEASFASNKVEAESFYSSLDKKMAEGLKIVSGLLKGKTIYATTNVARSVNVPMEAL